MMTAYFMAHRCNNAVWSALESCLVPPPASTTWYYSTVFKKSVAAVFLLAFGAVTGAFAGIQKICSVALDFWTKQKVDPKQDFSAVLDDSRLWQQLGDIEQSLIDDPLHLQLMGPATCTYQDSGRKVCSDSQWATYEEICIKDPSNRSGNTPSLFELYKTPEGRQEVIERLKKLNANAFRISIDWSLIQPKKDVWNLANIQIYVALCKDLRDAGIEVMFTLHQFAEPQWFHDLGSFEKEENIEHFVNFSRIICENFTVDYKGRPLVEYFCTINEPAVEAFSRYVLGSFSPGNILNFAKAGNFLKGALKAHCVVYDLFKKLAPPSVKVGIVHQYLRFIPANFLLIPITRDFTRLLNETPMNFFKNGGKFELKVPFLCNIEEQCAAPKTDFVGLQYYGRPVIGLRGSTSFYEPMTQMPMREDPEGMFEAAEETFKAFNAPIIVTESGISTHDDVQRSRYMTRVLYSLREAAKEIGAQKVQGYFVWSLGRNLEWNMGMKPQDFGAYALTDQGLAADPKPGMASYIKVAAAWLSWLKTNENVA